MADLKPILDPVPVDNSIKRQAWDAWHAADTPEKFRASFDSMPIPQDTKRALWNAKFSNGNTISPATPVTPGARPKKEGFVEGIGKDLSLGWRSGAAGLEHLGANLTHFVAPETSKSLDERSKKTAPTADELANREGFGNLLVQGAGALPASALTYAPAIAAGEFAPLVAGATDAAAAADRGVGEAAKAGVLGAAGFYLQGKAGKIPGRLARTLASAGALAVPAAIESGGDIAKTGAAAVLGGVLGGIGKEPAKDKAKVPDALKEAIRAQQSLSDDVKKVFAPAARSESAAKTARIARAHLGEAAQRADQAEFALRQSREFFDSQPPNPAIPGKMSAAGLQFIDAIETGQISTLPETLRPQAQAIRELFDERMERLQKHGLLNTYVENYFPHLWKKPEQAEEAFKLLSKRPLEGSKSFLKQRKFLTTKEGLEFAAQNPDKGLELASTNPIDIVLLKLREQDKLLTARDILGDMKKSGLLKFVSDGKAPAGHVKIDDKVSTVMFKRDGMWTIAGNFYAPEPAARVINNYLSPGLRNKTWFRNINFMANMMNQFQLGWSAFHLGFTTYDAAQSNFALGLEKVIQGSVKGDSKLVKGGVQDWLKTPIRAVEPIASGVLSKFGHDTYSNKIWQEWMKPGSHPDVAPIVEYAKQAGARVQMEPFYRTQIWRNMKRAWAEGNKIGAAFRFFPALTEQVMKPIMEDIVPRQKIAAFARLAEFEMSQLPENFTQDHMRKALGSAWDSIDNRMGQLVYDNKFWNQTGKNLLQASIRSVGWNWGTIAELGGGVKDLTTIMKRVNSGERVMTHRMAYVAVLPVVTGLIGAITTKLMTGENPKDLKDLYFPRTGNVDEYGRPERISYPTYMNDVFKWKNAVEQGGAAGVGKIAKGKMHPFIGLIGDMLSNEDWQGNKVHDPNDNFLQQRLQDIEYVGKEFVPFAAKYALDDAEKRSEGLTPRRSSMRDITALVGITPATAGIEKTDAEAYLDRHSDESRRSSDRTIAGEKRFGHIRDLERAFRLKVGEDQIRNIAQKWIDKGEFQEKDIEAARKRAEVPPLVRRMKNVNEFDVALHAYELALYDDSIPADEINQVRDIMQEKAYKQADKLSALPPTDKYRVRTLAKLKELGLTIGDTGSATPPPPGVQ